MSERKSSAAPILAAIAVVAVLLGAYVGGYFVLCERQSWNGGRGRVIVERLYPYWWVADAYQPAASVEERLRGIKVSVCGPGSRNRRARVKP